MTRTYVGIDIGGTTIKSSIVDQTGHMVPGPRIITGPDASGALVELAQRLVHEHSGVQGIGIVSPGIVDEAGGIVQYSANLDLEGFALVDAICNATGLPTRLSHDGRAGGMAEAVLGAGRGVNNFVVVPIGTGISAALFDHGNVISGARHSAGEIGHIPIYPDGEPCACGQNGCLEVYASASAIGRRYSVLSGRTADAREVESLLGIDPHADRVWEEAIQALALGLTHVTLMVDPAVIVIGGGLSGAGDILLAPLRTHMGRLMAWRSVPDLKVSQLGESAGRWGAAILGALAADSRDHENWSINE